MRARVQRMPMVRPDGTGAVKRGEGRNNIGYGPQRPGMSPSILAVHQRGAHMSLSGAVAGPDHSRDDAKRVLLEGMTRDELRNVCKSQNVQGYGKMNKAQLVEAALR